MKIFKFEVLADKQKNFYRHVEIKPEQTFREFHDLLVEKLELGGQELASFHVTDDDWNKLAEITLLDMSGEDDQDVKSEDAVQTIFLMSETSMDRFFDEPDQKMIYEYDFLQMHSFNIQLIDVAPAAPNKSYPNISGKGKLNITENVTVEQDSEKLKEELLKEFNSMLHDDSDDASFDEDGICEIPLETITDGCD